jgi:rifampin ADP-ribosylating transferase
MPDDPTTQPLPATGPRYPSPPPYYHGTRADRKVGDLIGPGYTSNYGRRKIANNIYFSATLEAAVWGAELAVGDGPGRIYIVEPTGPYRDDPNLTDTKFPGNPTKSYCSKHPLRVIGEVTSWQGHPPEQLQAMRAGIERLKQQGIEHIDD